MRIRFTYIFGLVCAAFSVLATSAPAMDSTSVEKERMAEPDSTHSYALDEIIVTALRLPQVSSLSASPVAVLTRRDLAFTNATSLADVLAPLPGVFIKSYGGTSGLKTISQRGMGAEHTLVMINGMRVSNPQNGLVDLGLIEHEGLDRLELIRGGQSASYGADAVAGVVNAVINALPKHRNVHAKSAFGSFGYRMYSLVAGGEIGREMWLRGGYREEKAVENFPFVFRNGSQRFDLIRTNSDFLSQTGFLQARARLEENLEVSVFGRTFKSERGVGGPVVGPASTGVARQKDEDNLVQVMATIAQAAPLRYRVGVQFHHSFLRYTDRSFIIGSSSLSNEFRNVDLRIEPSVDYTMGEATRLAVGGELAVTKATGNALKQDVFRASYAGYATVQQRLLDEGEIVKDMLFVPALRYDAVRTTGEMIASWSPQVGLVCSFQEIANVLKTTLRASFSRNFRAPTFNELYYGGGGGVGNPKLQPERSTGVDVGGEFSLKLAGTHRLECTYFDIGMENRIVWASAGAMTVTPKNLRKVRSNGIELSYRGLLLDDHITLGVSYTSLIARKTQADYPGDRTANTFLIYVPQQAAHYLIGFLFPIADSWLREIGTAVNVSFVGHRYVTEDNLRYLPSYTLVNANVDTRLMVAEATLLARLEVNNLFNEEYQNVPSYPMPLRSFRATIGIEF